MWYKFKRDFLVSGFIINKHLNKKEIIYSINIKLQQLRAEPL